MLKIIAHASINRECIYLNPWLVWIVQKAMNNKLGETLWVEWWLQQAFDIMCLELHGVPHVDVFAGMKIKTGVDLVTVLWQEIHHAVSEVPASAEASQFTIATLLGDNCVAKVSHL